MTQPVSVTFLENVYEYVQSSVKQRDIRRYVQLTVIQRFDLAVLIWFGNQESIELVRRVMKCCHARNAFES
jgi:hypothetical protein